MKKSCFLFLTVMVLSAACAIAAEKRANSLETAASSKNADSRMLRWSFTLRNTTPRVIAGSKFLTYVPVVKNSLQELLEMKASYPYEMIEDEKGNRILRFVFKDFEPYGTRIISLEAIVSRRPSASAIDLKDSAVYLAPEKYIESDNAEIAGLAKELQKTDRLKTAESIFRWVADNIKYEGYTEQPRGALYALEQKRGDCTEMAYLFAALCRANGIAARVCGGYICPGNKVLKPSDYHDWAEFYIDKRWRVADPQKNVYMSAQSDYVAMKIMGESAKNPISRYNRFYSEPAELQAVMND